MFGRRLIYNKICSLNLTIGVNKIVLNTQQSKVLINFKSPIMHTGLFYKHYNAPLYDYNKNKNVII